jgi:hypothetical protein
MITNDEHYDEWTGATVNLAVAHVAKISQTDAVKSQLLQVEVNNAVQVLLNTELKVSGTKKLPNSKQTSTVNGNSLLVRLAQHCGLTGGLINTYLSQSSGISSLTYSVPTAQLALEVCGAVVKASGADMDYNNLVNGLAQGELLNALQDFDPNYTDVEEETIVANNPFVTTQTVATVAQPVIPQPVIPQPVSTVETTVESGFVELDTLIEMMSTINGQDEIYALALELFKGSWNMNKDGNYCLKTNGNVTGQVRPDTLAKGMSWGSEMNAFKGVICGGIGFNIIGCYSKRGTRPSVKYATNHCLEDSNKSYILTAITAALIVEANVTRFNYDLRKHLSPNDIDRLCDIVGRLSDDELDQSVEGTKASTWLLKSYEGYSSGKMSQEEQSNMVASALSSLL